MSISAEAAFLIVSLAASGLLVGLVLLAHVLKPEISPRWRMLSELAIGRWGVVMNMAFIAWAASNMALAVALWPLVPAWGAALLILVSIGPLGAAFFVADPITTPPEQGSATGRWHAIFGVLFILGFPVVVALLAVSAIATASPLWPWFLGMGVLVWAWCWLPGGGASVGRWVPKCRSACRTGCLQQPTRHGLS